MAWRLPAVGAAPSGRSKSGALELQLTDGAAVCVRSGPTEPWAVAEPIPEPMGWGGGCAPDPQASARLLLGPELEVGAGLVELTYLEDRPLSWRMPGQSDWKRLDRDDGGTGLLLVPASVCLLLFSNRIEVARRGRYLIIDP